MKINTYPLYFSSGNFVFRSAFCLLHATEYPQLKSDIENFLHPDEKKYFDKPLAKKRHISFLLGRVAAKLALNELHPNLNFAGCAIVPGIFTQPVIQWPEAPRGGGSYEVSISHCAELACACAFDAKMPMGIDLELISAERSKTMQSQCTDEELSWMAKSPAEESLLSAVLWTAKEALSKVIKMGLTVSLRLLETQEIKTDGPTFTGSYTHFSAYQFTTFYNDKMVMTVVYPKTAKCDWPQELQSLHVDA